MPDEKLDQETLRLLRAFFRISDPLKRHELLKLVEKAIEKSKPN